MIVRIHGKSHGLSYIPLISNAMKGRYEIEYTERIYLFIFLLDEKWNEKSPCDTRAANILTFANVIYYFNSG